MSIEQDLLTLKNQMVQFDRKADRIIAMLEQIKDATDPGKHSELAQRIATLHASLRSFRDAFDAHVRDSAPQVLTAELSEVVGVAGPYLDDIRTVVAEEMERIVRAFLEAAPPFGPGEVKPSGVNSYGSVTLNVNPVADIEAIVHDVVQTIARAKHADTPTPVPNETASAESEWEFSFISDEGQRITIAPGVFKHLVRSVGKLLAEQAKEGGR